MTIRGHRSSEYIIVSSIVIFH